MDQAATGERGRARLGGCRESQKRWSGPGAGDDPTRCTPDFIDRYPGYSRNCGLGWRAPATGARRSCVDKPGARTTHCLTDGAVFATVVDRHWYATTTRGVSVTGTELEHLIFQHLPETFFRRALQAIFQARRLGWDDCEARFAEAEAENLRPYYTRGQVEGLLRDVAALFPGVEAVPVKAVPGNWYHTEVRSGPVVLTANSVPVPCGPVHKAKFRRTLARSNQGMLWEEEIDEDTPLYALLLHSKSVWTKRDDRLKYGYLPGSVYVAFPSADLDCYLHEINLFERFPDVVAAHMPEEWDQEAQVRYLYRAQKAESS